MADLKGYAHCRRPLLIVLSFWMVRGWFLMTNFDGLGMVFDGFGVDFDGLGMDFDGSGVIF